MPRHLTPAVFLALPALALAQPEADTPPAPSSDRWSAAAELRLWRPALQDDLTLPGQATMDVDAVNLDENELTPSLYATFTNGDWDIELGGFIFGTDSPGGEIDYSSLELFVTNEVWARELSDDVALRLNLGGGLRATDMSVDLTGGMGASDDSIWGEALVAARLGIELPRDFSFNVAADAGGGFKSTTWSLGTSVTWQPEPYLGAQLGYRFLRTDLDDDGFEFDGALAGLYAGFVFEF